MHNHLHSHTSPVGSNVYDIQTPTTGNKRGSGGPKTTLNQTQFHSSSPIYTHLCQSQNNSYQSDKENSTSVGQNSKRVPQLSKKNTPLTNITSDYINRKLSPRKPLTSNGSSNIPKPPVLNKPRHHARRLQVNLATKFNDADTTSTNIPVDVPNHVPTSIVSALTTKRSQPDTVNPDHHNQSSGDDSESSDSNQFEDETDSESDVDQDPVSPTDVLSNGRQGLCSFHITNFVISISFLSVQSYTSLIRIIFRLF
jgi:hypothetical protein